MPLPWHAPATSSRAGNEVRSWQVLVFGSGEYAVPLGWRVPGVVFCSPL